MNIQTTLPRFNCLSEGDDINDFTTFYVAPCRNDAAGPDSEELTETVQCEPGNAEFYSIYGIKTGADCCEWLAIHDEWNAFDAVRIACQIHRETRTPFFYRDERNGSLPGKACADFVDIAQALTEQIHDDLPDLDADNFARVDDFDTHPLAEIREAFVVFSNYNGENAALNPYEAGETATPIAVGEEPC